MLSLLIAFTLAAPPGPAKEPAYRGTPRYLALSFAADGADRVWLALDGDTLHVDRDGNGDLTDPGEAVTRITGDGVSEGAAYFETETVAVAGRPPWRVSATFTRLDSHAEGRFTLRPGLRAALARDPHGFAARLWLDARHDLSDDRGPFRAGPFDLAGPLVPARSPADAPVVRIGGPLTVTFDGIPPELQAGRSVVVPLAVGSPGLGPGTFAAFRPDGPVPAATAVVEVSLPGPPPYRERHDLTDCNHLCASVRLADAAPAGQATVTLSLANWPGHAVAPTTHPVTVRPLAAPPPAETVSKELVVTLPPPVEAAGTVTVAFSPDGTRLLAADAKSGVLGFYDVATRREVRRIAPGVRARWSSQRFALSPDWATLFVPAMDVTVRRGNRDAPAAERTALAGEIRVWDVATGATRPALPLPTGVAPVSMALSPDGRTVLVVEADSYDRPGPARRFFTAVIDVATGEHRVVLAEEAFGVFAPNGRTVYLNRRTAGLRVARFDVTTAKRLAEVPSPAGRMMRATEVSPDGTTVAVIVVGHEPGGAIDMRFLDPAALAEQGRMAAPGPPDGVGWGYGRFTPDGTRYVLFDGDGNPHVWNVAARAVERRVRLGDDRQTRAHAISPDGRTLAVARLPTYWPTPGDEPHAHVVLLDLAGREPPRTLVAPRGVPTALAFSPDGRVLALGGAGGVHLFAVP